MSYKLTDIITDPKAPKVGEKTKIKVDLEGNPFEIQQTQWVIYPEQYNTKDGAWGGKSVQPISLSFDVTIEDKH